MMNLEDHKRSFLELAAGVDSFPDQLCDAEAYKAFVKPYYKFQLAGFRCAFGLVPSNVVHSFDWPDYWALDHAKQSLTLRECKDFEERSKLFAATLSLMVAAGGIPGLKRLRGELVPTFGPNGEIVLNIDRAACILFATVAYGVQMIAWSETQEGLVKYWIPRRAKSRRSYPGMLDNCVGGAISSGESVLDCLVREAYEEASLPEEYVREHATPYGVLSYHMAQDGNGNEGHQPQVQYVYHIKLTSETKPTPLDGEVEKFEQLTLEEVQEALANGEFKTNCNLTWIAYLIMLGKLNGQNEGDLCRISTHLHRRLDFPVK